MNQIIVAIDFSKSSLHALKYAIFLANQMKSNVMMVWVDNLVTSESVFSDIGADTRDDAKKNLEEILEQHKNLLSTGELTYKLRRGKVYYEMAQHARQTEARLIVTGTHGVSGFDEFLIGSNAYRIVSNAPCPVVTIRPHYDFSRGVNNIVLPIDETKNSCQKAPFAAMMAKTFGATIHILSLYSTPLKAFNQKVDNCVADVRKNFAEQGIQCTVESVIAENVSHSTLEFAERIGAEMIAITTEPETTLSNLILGQYAQHMVNNSPIPVLTINPAEIMKPN